MTGFAGSRSLDDRRRRRLVTGSESVAFEPVAEPVRTRRSPPARVKRDRRGPAHFPLRKVISIRYWKLTLVVLAAALGAAAILAGGWAASIYREQLGPGFELLFRLDSARLVHGFAAVGLFLCGELALLISWVRSQSLQDFNGRYRGWLLCAILAFVAAIGLETPLASAWSATATWLWPIPLASASIGHKATLLWLIPAALTGLSVHAYLVREMRDCRVSLVLVWLAFLLGSAAATVLISRPLPLPTAQGRLLECGVAMAFVLCAFASLLFHARHVVYVCVDPPAIRPSRLRAVLGSLRLSGLLKFIRPRPSKPRKTADSGSVASLKRRTKKRAGSARRKSAAVDPKSNDNEAETVTREPKKTLVAERPGTPAASEVRIAQSTTQNRRGTNPPSAPGSKTTPASITSTGSDADEEEPTSSSVAGAQRAPLEGLSRKERRLLKKQMRADHGQLRRSA